MTPAFRKRGSTRSGWHARASGTLGKTGNCQIAVSLHRTDARGSSPLGFRLYLPKGWTDDPARCQAAGVPDEVSFQPNWQLAVALIDQALSWELERPAVVLADAAYGEVTAFRQALEGRELAYAVGISQALAAWPEPPDGAVPNGTGRGRPVKWMRFGDQKPVSVKELALTHPKRFRTVDLARGQPRPAHVAFLGPAGAVGSRLEPRPGAG
jgi:SRSO17 transposase